MKKLTTLALAALLTTVSATSVFAAGPGVGTPQTTTNTEVGYTTGGITPPDGSGTYVVKIPKTVTITGEGDTGAADLNVEMQAIEGEVANLPTGLNVDIWVASANGYQLTTDKLTGTDENNTKANWNYYYSNAQINAPISGDYLPGTGREDQRGDQLKGENIKLGNLQAASAKIFGKAVMPTKPTVITNTKVKFTDTLTYTIEETNSGITQ